MWVVGLTGGIGSGKSEVSRRFEALGIKVVDADIISRDVVAPNSPALQSIKSRFGETIINAEGALDRAQLRAIIFSQPQEKTWLEALLHPLIRQQIIHQLNTATSPYAILSSPLLLETTQRQLVDRILVIDASEDLQLARASARDGNKSTQIRAIMKTQLPRAERCALADDIIANQGDLAELDQQVLRLHAAYLSLAQQHDTQVT